MFLLSSKFSRTQANGKNNDKNLSVPFIYITHQRNVVSLPYLRWWGNWGMLQGFAKGKMDIKSHSLTLSCCLIQVAHLLLHRTPCPAFPQWCSRLCDFRIASLWITDKNDGDCNGHMDLAERGANSHYLRSTSRCFFPRTGQLPETQGHLVPTIHMNQGRAYK